MNTFDFFSLKNRVAVVTGAGGHLGSSMSMALASAGARVQLLGRSLAPLEIVRRKIVALGGAADVHRVDVTKSEQIVKFLSDLREDGLGLDILVHNAYAGGTGLIADTSKQKYDEAFSIAVSSVADFNHHAMGQLEESARLGGQPSIINISSMYGNVSPDPQIYGNSGQNSPPWYGSAKAALIQYTKYAAVHFAPLGIRVNSISPGPFPNNTGLDLPEDFLAQLASKTPMRRTGEADEIGGTVVFLASSASSFVTGENIAVDGGWTAW